MNETIRLNSHFILMEHMCYDDWWARKQTIMRGEAENWTIKMLYQPLLCKPFIGFLRQVSQMC